MSFIHSLREAKATLITPERIKILRLREELVFEASAIGLYMSLDGKKVTINDTGATVLLFGFSFVIKTQIMTSASFHKCRIKILFLLNLFPEVHFTDSSISTVFIFDSVMKHLKKIQRGNETITIEYLQNRSSTFKHSSGGKITVKYNDKGFLREARLQDGSGNEKRW